MLLLVEVVLAHHCLLPDYGPNFAILNLFGVYEALACVWSRVD